MKKIVLFIFLLISISGLLILYKTISERKYWSSKIKGNNSSIIYISPGLSSTQLWEYDFKDLGKRLLIDLANYPNVKVGIYTNPLLVALNHDQDKVALKYIGTGEGLIIYDRFLNKTLFELNKDLNSRILVSWSPLDDRLAYSFGLDDLGNMVSSQQLYVVDFINGSPRETLISSAIIRKQITSEPFESFAWSKNGEHLFYRENSSYKAYQIKQKNVIDTDLNHLNINLNRENPKPDIAFKIGHDIRIDSAGCGSLFIIACRHSLVINGKKVIDASVIDKVIWNDTLQAYIVEAGDKLYLVDDSGKKLKLANGQFVTLIE